MKSSNASPSPPSNPPLFERVQALGEPSSETENLCALWRARYVVNAISGAQARLFIERQIEQGASISSFQCRQEVARAEVSAFQSALERCSDYVDMEALDLGPGSYAVDLLCVDPLVSGQAPSILWISLAGPTRTTASPGAWAGATGEERFALKGLIGALCEARELNAALPDGALFTPRSL